MRFDLQQLRTRCSESTVADWNVLRVSSGEGYGMGWEMSAVLASDLRVAVRWGAPHASDFMAEWLARGGVESAASHWVDLLYCGQPVESLLRVRVAEVGLPVPTIDAVGAWIPFHARRLFSVLNALEGGGGIDDALTTFNIRVR